MKLAAISAILLSVGVAPAFATGTHSGGHKTEKMAIGEPGQKGKVKRTVNITMAEKDDGAMVFEPAAIKVKAGETIRLRFTNKGEADHEYVMDEEPTVMEHKAVMAKFPEMEHADANSIRLAPGKTGEILWTFSNAGDFVFACLIPGHYESGMKGNIQVSQ
ncbi:cupredoxin family protein [Mesorhizobium sp. VNQ89]|jgi:uncharacterized cupredoxin-like copper-binding protein|uniref:cupredoxin domain-containing protein n=1 Tax=Mesorhizobium quangtriensis TaxID=3157709 RepID=UPI0032B7BA50